MQRIEQVGQGNDQWQIAVDVWQLSKSWSSQMATPQPGTMPKPVWVHVMLHTKRTIAADALVLPPINKFFQKHDTMMNWPTRVKLQLLKLKELNQM